MRVLFLSSWYPYPADNGSRLRIYHLLRQLSSRHEISLISFTDEPVSDDRLRAMRALCAEVKTVQQRRFKPGRLKAILGFFSTRPRSVVDTYTEEMTQTVLREATRFRPDVVVASQMDTAPYARRLDARRVLDEVEVTVLYEAYARARSKLRRFRAWLTWQKLTAYLRSLLYDFDGYTVVSDAERRRVIQATATRTPVAIVPNGVDVEVCARIVAQPKPDTLIYSGALTYGANFDAVNYFLREIFPLIQAKRPGVKLFVTGKLDGVNLDVLPRNDGVVFTGYLDDVRPRIAQSWVSVVPLRIGGGTRLKILESLALGTPVVATSKGVEGLDFEAGRELCIADAPSEFANQVVRLLEDHALRETLSLAGRRAVTARYNWSAIGQSFCDFLEGIVQGEGAREYEPVHA
ncbi:MAG: glycosyltransferase family 4 protein [Anaerolineae bacterium]|nr:glycosyltransferase family 4 protein [Candidatus Roseilinea sp.]MDW8448419.1 glycosyltransferase family 4 protein [Anaerolineae bacterium]